MDRSPFKEISSQASAERSSQVSAISVTPNTQHPSPHTTNPTPDTLHPAPFTLHPSPFTLRLTPYTLHHTPYTQTSNRHGILPSPTPSTPHPKLNSNYSQARECEFEDAKANSRHQLAFISTKIGWEIPPKVCQKMKPHQIFAAGLGGALACAPRRINRIILKVRAVPIGTVLYFRTATLQKCEAVPRRARI